MSTTTISQHSCPPASRRPALDVLVEKLARRALAWSARREAERLPRNLQPTHERMALIRENERQRLWAGSPYGH